MKPNFALSLSFDGIALLHRAAGGWRRVGSVALDCPDMTGEITRIRERAQEVEPDGIRCKIVIPNDQIRYLSIETGRLNEDARRDAAAQALEGATPYALDDLAFDVSADGAITHVAAVALETLAEAEAFAVEHKLNPVSFVAVPDTEPFLGEPFFGPAANAANLPAEDAVEPDGIAVVVIGDIEEAPPAQIPGSIPPAPPDISTGHGTAASRPLEEAQPAVATPGFSSRRKRQDADPAPAGNTENGDSAAPRSPRITAIAPSAPVVTDPSADPEADRSPQTGGTRPVPVDPEPPVVARGATVGSGATADFPTRRDADAPSAPAAVVAHAIPAAPPSPRIEDLPPDDETARLTVFGARETGATRGKPRHLGLLLTIALLLFLAAVAAWASIFLDKGVAGLFQWDQDSETQVATAPAVEMAPAVEQPTVGLSLEPVPTVPAPSPAEIAVLPAPSHVPVPAPVVAAPADEMPVDESPVPADMAEAPADATLPDSGTSLSGTDAAVLDALRADPVPAAATDSDTPRAEALYAASGIWQTPPEVPETPSIIGLDDLYIASIDRTDLSHDAVALPIPDTQAGDTPVATLASPVAADTRFDLDERGLVTPTPDGTLSPEGILVYLGRPPVIPPPTPDRKQPIAEEDQKNARLAGIRPKSRPGKLTDSAERVQLGGLSREELSKVHPKLRPPVSRQAADQDETPTAQAVATATRPKARPSGFTRVVRMASPAPAATGAQKSVAAPATVSPRIPTSASVARQATLENTINLRKVNLIGVYGTPSNRRALVRLPSGRYKKVKVGDAVDGGRVVAIGDAELRYQKSGRNLTLKMPKG